MLTTIKGIYENGQIVLDEIPPTKNKSKVVVTFLEEIESPPLKKRPFGSLKGKIGIPHNLMNRLTTSKTICINAIFVRHANTNLAFARQFKTQRIFTYLN